MAATADGGSRYMVEMTPDVLKQMIDAVTATVLKTVEHSAHQRGVEGGGGGGGSRGGGDRSPLNTRGWDNIEQFKGGE